MPSFSLDSPKIEVFETGSFGIIITQNDHPSYVKHVFRPIWVSGPGGGGGLPRAKGLVHNLFMQFFTLDGSKMEVFETCFFDIVTT